MHSNASRLTWEEVQERALAAVDCIRREMRMAMSDSSKPPDVLAELNMWYDRITPPNFGDVPIEMRDCGRLADDPRLAHIPFPSFAKPVESDPCAPRPPRPDQSLVPPHATGWEHAIKPPTFQRCLTHQRQCRDLFRYASPQRRSRGRTDYCCCRFVLGFGVALHT